MDFILGCNYWASNAGTEMWRNFDTKVIEKDLKILSEHGVRYMRVFPNWRDFQPVAPIHFAFCEIIGYCKEGGNTAETGDFIDETMMGRFAEFLKLCEKYNIKLIVGLITGWMSGGMFIPAALYGKNLISDPLALYFEQLFIKGFVTRFKDSDCIYAWDLGNECNCMSPASRWEAANWTATISNAIKAADPTRPVVSGMHSLGTDRNWNFEDHAKYTDILTTHPYPFFGQHTKNDAMLSLRTTMHATAQNKLFTGVTGLPCLAEEVGTLGPMMCSNEKAADFLRINLFSHWANGAPGLMWWCANEQTALNTYPYTNQMVEQELGMLTADLEPKPVLKEMKVFADLMDKLDITLASAKTDAVCILTREQDTWGVAYMTHILARKAGLNFRFAYGENELPESDAYLLPSVNGIQVMPKDKYETLKKKVREGADLYISLDNGVLSEFEALTGVKVVDSYESPSSFTADVDGVNIPFTKLRNFMVEATKAEVLVRDNTGNPFVTVCEYGKGRVFFVNAPIERGLITLHNAFDSNTHLIYKKIFADIINNSPVMVSGDDVVFTYHPSDDGAYVVVLNHSDAEKPFEITLKNGLEVKDIIYGELGKIKPFDAVIIKVN